MIVTFLLLLWHKRCFHLSSLCVLGLGLGLGLGLSVS